MNDDAPVLTAHLFGELHEALIDRLRSLSPDAWLAPTSAGEWRVRDVVAHLLDGDLRRIAVDRDGHTQPPPAPIADYADLVRWLDALNAAWVAAARRLSTRTLIELLEGSGPEVARIMAAHDPAAEATFPVAWAGQHVSPMWLDIGREFTERWHHQDQIREATGAPPLDAPHLLRPVLAISLRALPTAWAPLAREDGTRIAIRVTGGAGGDWSLTRLGGGWRLREEMSAMEAGAAAVACSITVPDLVLARLLLHRLGAQEAAPRIRVEGDAALAAPVLHARAVMV